MAAAALGAVFAADPLPNCKAALPSQFGDGGLERAAGCGLARPVDAAGFGDFFGKPSMYMGTGGTIPFMGMLGEKFPAAQFLVTGLLGPKSNAHGPNEFLHIETGKRLTGCVAGVLADHYRYRTQA